MVTNPLPLAQALIRCPSVTPEDHGVLEVMGDALKTLGFELHYLTFDGDDGPKTGNLYARLGTGSPHICFAGHVDVVPVGDHAAWSHEPFDAIIEDGYLYGRGAEDMKGALACMVAAVEQFLADGGQWAVDKNSSTVHRPPSTGSISFLITGDEEGFAINGTRKVVEWLKARGEIPDGCVVGEPTNPEHIGEMIKIGRRGSLNVTLTVKGRQGHVAYPHLAENPVTVLVNILHALKHEKLDEGTEYFPPSNLEISTIDVGNPSNNVIPAQAMAKFNIRFNNRHTLSGLHGWIHEICKRFTSTYELQFKSTGEAFVTKPCSLSQNMVDAAKFVTGRTPVLSTTGGVSDAIFIKTLCPVIEFGTTGYTPHMVNERVKIEDLNLLTQCYAEFLKLYFK